jgi:hypothetical protein
MKDGGMDGIYAEGKPVAVVVLMQSSDLSNWNKWRW